MQDRFSLSRGLLIWAATLLACALTTQHAAAQALPPAVAACMSEQDSTQRLACYDREVPRAAATRSSAPSAASTTTAPAVPRTRSPASNSAASAAPPAGTTSAPPASTAPASAPSPESKVNAFGLTPQLQAQQSNTPPASVLAKLTAHITAVSQLPRGESVVTLDNGQIWEEAEATSHLPLRVGDEITIKRGMLGAYYMSTKEVLGLRAKRVH
jgi:hypothetical protein